MVSGPVNGEGARLRDRAVAAARSGDISGASLLFRQAASAAPRDASILNSAANHFSGQGQLEEAIKLLETAVEVDPSAAEPLLNLAILLTREGRWRHALELLQAQEEVLCRQARYWAVRAGAERAAGRKRDSLASYERAVAIDPTNPRALEGRARLTLETGREAVEYYRSLLAVSPGSATGLLGYGQALEAAGELDPAHQLARRLVEQAPAWIDALEWLAQLRWAAGERDSFTSHYEDASSKAGTVEVFASWCRMFAGVDRFAEAADVAERGRAMFGNSSQFALLEAIHRGQAGDDRATAIFEELELQSVVRRVEEARHWLRRREPGRAEALLASAIAESPDHISAWALRDIGWRLSGDPRHEWLHQQRGLVQPIELGLKPDQMEAAIALLDQLHDRSAMPVGQSVRDGSQTRGGLFDRHEPEVRWIEEAFRDAVGAYRHGLPEYDADHPLLRHRDSPWTFAGSWSIRALSGGRHTEHIHPQGLISSAAYFVVPQVEKDDDPQAGCLELGRPPPDLRLDLPPLCSIQPRPGRCALFPSTLYHGTRRFAAGKRMTVAIDIHLGNGG